MDIQATKLQLVQQILNTNEAQILKGVQELLDQSADVDFWDELNKEDQAAIDEGIDQLNKGLYYNSDQAKAETKRRLNWE